MVLNLFKEEPELSVGCQILFGRCIPLIYRQRLPLHRVKDTYEQTWDSNTGWGQLSDLKDAGRINLLCVQVGIRAVWSESLGVQFYLRMLHESSLDQQRISYLLTPEQIWDR